MVDSFWTKRSMRFAVHALAASATVMLVGCEGQATFDVTTNSPADPTIQSVFVDIAGIELSGGGTQTLVFDEPVRIDLMEYVGGNLFRLFTDEELDEGRYTGARLLFSTEDEDDNEDVVRRSDGDFELVMGEGTVADVRFTIDEEDSSREDIVLTLDLRQSLSFDDNDDVYTLTPVLRGTRTENAGQISGRVTASCPGGASLAQGGAVYLFSGDDVTPDDRDGAGVEPYLTIAVGADGGTALPAYTFRYIPEGDYTIALTCDGDEDDAATDDDLRYQKIANVRVRAEETVTLDL